MRARCRDARLRDRKTDASTLPTGAGIPHARPTYPQFEAWVKKQPGVKLDRATIEKHNASVRGFNHDDETRLGILKNNDLPDDALAPKDAVHLNDLDSWQEFHEAVLK